MEFQHLKEKRVSYAKHACRALHYSFLSLKAGIIFAIHAIYPDVFETTGSDTVISLHALFEEDGIIKKD
jgi:hypothetical protein